MFLKKCLLGKSTRAPLESAINNRFFFVNDEGVAGTICPIAAEAAYGLLRHENPNFLTAKDLLIAIQSIPRNSSIAGFAVEAVALRIIADRGFQLNGGKSYPNMELCEFADVPVIDTRVFETVLHAPVAWNYPAVDAVITSTYSMFDLAKAETARICRITGIGACNTVSNTRVSITGTSANPQSSMLG